MNYQKQIGATTLLITSILLSITLIATLGSYKNLFYQIKRAQNEVKARQVHWATEGGLECLFSYVKEDATRITDLTFENHNKLDALCKTPMSLNKLYLRDLGRGGYRIQSLSNLSGASLFKTFSIIGSENRGAIQTTSRLTTYGDLNISPDVQGPPNDKNQYECVSMTFKYSVTIKGSPTAKYQTEGVKENSVYPNNPAGSCTANSTTSVNLKEHEEKNKTDTVQSSDPDLRDDFVHDTNIEPFETFFGDKKTPENIAKVKASFPEEGRISISDAKNCKSAIENAYKKVDKVWVTGNCAIHGNLTLNGNHKKHTLVIQDGIFINTGSTKFEGSLFHLVDKTKPQFLPENLEPYWNSLFATPEGAPTDFKIGEQFTDLKQTVYVDAGSFHATGGYGFDTDGLKASIAGSMQLQFDSSKRPTITVQNIKWRQGSWNDF